MTFADGASGAPVIFSPRVHGDQRGFLVETFRAERLARSGLDVTFVQDNQSRSCFGTIRGMHFQPGQAKLVRCARGAIFDVIVDIRPGSPTFGAWQGYELDDERHHQLFVPDGFAHGFCVTSDLADVTYKITSYYDQAVESGFRFDDPAVGIAWPIAPDLLIASARDMAAPTLAEIRPSLSSENIA